MKIAKILTFKYGAGRRYASVKVQLDDGSSAWVYVGGEVETWFDDQHDRTKAYVKRNVDKVR